MTTLSVGVPNFGGWLGGDWSRLLDLARAAEDAGMHRIVVNDHLVMGRNTDAYSWGRFPTPPEAPWLEPLTCLTAVAAVTSRIRLGTGILIAPLRPAPVLAKTVATLDVLSGGRVDLGVGVGWQKEEYDAVGLDFDLRGQLLDDTIGACRALWTELPATFTSLTTAFADVFCSPLPVQSPLPVWFSGTLNNRNLRRVTELGNGWIPIMGATVDDIRDGAARLRASTDRRLDVQAPPVYVRNADKTPDLEATMASVPDLVAAGATDVLVHLPAYARESADAPRVISEIAQLFEKVST